MKTVAEVIGVSRSNLAERLQECPQKRIGELVAQIKAVIAELPTYGYRRVHAILKRQALAAGLKPPNHKRVYRVMKGSWPAARSPCGRCRAAPRRSHCGR
jgi:putative transposase